MPEHNGKLLGDSAMPNDKFNTIRPTRATVMFDADFTQSADFQFFMSHWSNSFKSWAAWGVVVAIVGQARRSQGYKADISGRRAMALQRLLQIPSGFLEEVIEAAVESTMFVREGDFVYSPYQMRNIQQYVQRCETNKENAKKRYKKHTITSDGTAIALPSQSESLRALKNIDDKIRLDTDKIRSDTDPIPTVPQKTKKPEPEDSRQAYGPDGWFLSTPEQYAVMVKEKGQQWVDYWVDAFCDWAQSKKPAVSRSRKNHWLSIKRWEQMRVETGKQWYNAHSAGPGYFYAEEVQKDAARMFGGPNSFGGTDAN